MSKRNQAFITIIVVLYGIILLMTAFSLSLPIVFGQQAQAPTVGKLNFQEQPAIIVTKVPEGFNVQNSSLGTGNELTNLLLGIAGSSTVTGILNGVYTKIKGDKAIKKAEVAQTQVQETKTEVQEIKPVVAETKEIVNQTAQTQVKLANVAQKSLELQYDTMGVEKANAIKDKPEIQIKKVVEIKEEALKTTAKAK